MSIATKRVLAQPWNLPGLPESTPRGNCYSGFHKLGYSTDAEKVCLVEQKWEDNSADAETPTEPDQTGLPQDFLDLDVLSLNKTVSEVIDEIGSHAGDKCDYTWNKHSSEYHVECAFHYSETGGSACCNLQLKRAPGNRARFAGQSAWYCTNWENFGPPLLTYYSVFLEVAKATD